MPATLDHLYSDRSETLNLLTAGQVWAHIRLNADDMLAVVEAAKFVGTTPELLIREAADGQLIGVPSDPRGMVFPKWQFTPVFISAIHAVAQMLSTHDGWTLLRFFESPHIALDELSPQQAIEQGYSVARIVDLARAWEYS